MSEQVTPSKLPTWAKEVAEAVGTFSYLGVITACGILGFFLIPSWIGVPRWAYGVIGAVTLFSGIKLFFVIGNRIGLARLAALGREARGERGRVRVDRSLSRAGSSRDAKFVDAAAKEPKRTRAYCGPSAELDALGIEIESARKEI